MPTNENPAMSFFGPVIASAKEMKEMRDAVRGMRLVFKAMREESYTDDEIKMYFHSLTKGTFDGIVEGWLKEAPIAN